MSREETRRIALERIHILFRLADEVFPENPERAQRYIDLARRIAMRCRVKLPRELRRRICKYCKSLLRPGVNCRVRVRQRREPHIVVTCFNCGRVSRYPIRRKG
ncbi:ribonuclease P [Candidatus Bathyarchaeota archaeon]|nr:MAG: ribonuclease P [Candidatus Bathyarchaeota archaeon]